MRIMLKNSRKMVKYVVYSFRFVVQMEERQ